MLVETIAGALITAKIRRGSFKNLMKADIKAWYLFIAGFTLQGFPLLVKLIGGEGMAKITDTYFLYMNIFSYVLIMLGLVLNTDKIPFRLVLAGTMLNFAVIAANGGLMPVLASSLEFTGFNMAKLVNGRLDMAHTLASEFTRLVALADIIPLPKPYPLPKVLSVGDIFIAVGIFLFIQDAMLPSGKHPRILPD